MNGMRMPNGLKLAQLPEYAPVGLLANAGQRSSASATVVSLALEQENSYNRRQ